MENEGCAQWLGTEQAFGKYRPLGRPRFGRPWSRTIFSSPDRGPTAGGLVEPGRPSGVGLTIWLPEGMLKWTSYAAP